VSIGVKILTREPCSSQYLSMGPPCLSMGQPCLSKPSSAFTSLMDVAVGEKPNSFSCLSRSSPMRDFCKNLHTGPFRGACSMSLEHSCSMSLEQAISMSLETSMSLEQAPEVLDVFGDLNVFGDLDVFEGGDLERHRCVWSRCQVDSQTRCKLRALVQPSSPDPYRTRTNTWSSPPSLSTGELVTSTTWPHSTLLPCTQTPLAPGVTHSLEVGPFCEHPGAR